MAKLTAWLVTLLGVILVLATPQMNLLHFGGSITSWVVALIVLIVGIGELTRNYSKKRK